MSPFGGFTPADDQSMGVYFGSGTQDEYAKIVCAANGGAGGVEWGLETAGVFAGSVQGPGEGVSLIAADHVDLFLRVHPGSLTVTPSVSVDDGPPVVGAPMAFPASWVAGPAGPAVGLISTSRNATPFPANWDYLYVTPESGGTLAQALVEMTPNGNIDASTYGNGSFIVTNQSGGGEKIVRVSLDLSTALFPDLVFDPVGAAGDLTAKCFTANAGGAATGLVPFGDDCVDPFSVPHDGGYDRMEMTFTDFDPGETFTFSVDVDPTSIQGTSAPGPNNSGSVSGLELSGTTLEIEFDDSTLLTTQPFRVPGSDGGSRATAAIGLPPAPTLEVLNVTPPATVSDPNRTARIGGPVGYEAYLLVVEGGLFTQGLPGGGFDLDPFEANSAILVTELTATIGGGGTVDVPFSLTDSDPEAGLNYLVAALRVPGGADPTGPLSPIRVLEYDALYVGVPVGVPLAYALGQNAPNPFQGGTRLRFALPRSGPTNLVIYDVSGRRVRTLVDDPLPAGYHDLHWDGRNTEGLRVSSGVYFYRMRSGEFTEVKRMTLLR